MVDARPEPGGARLRRVLAVILDQRQVDSTVGQMPRGVVSHLAGFHLDKAERFLVKLRRLLQIIDFKSDMNDARHDPSVAKKPALTRLGERIQLYPKRGSGSFRVRKTFTRRKISRFARNDNNLSDLSSRTK